jgi:hypothetical protein
MDETDARTHRQPCLFIIAHFIFPSVLLHVVTSTLLFPQPLFFILLVVRFSSSFILPVLVFLSIPCFMSVLFFHYLFCFFHYLFFFLACQFFFLVSIRFRDSSTCFHSQIGLFRSPVLVHAFYTTCILVSLPEHALQFRNHDNVHYQGEIFKTRRPIPHRLETYPGAYFPKTMSNTFLRKVSELLYHLSLSNLNISKE